MKFEEEFKQAIRELPEKEKDKLLMRLLKKDRILKKIQKLVKAGEWY